MRADNPAKVAFVEACLELQKEWVESYEADYLAPDINSLVLILPQANVAIRKLLASGQSTPLSASKKSKIDSKPA